MREAAGMVGMDRGRSWGWDFPCNHKDIYLGIPISPLSWLSL
jgi:hypothetical protein